METMDWPAVFLDLNIIEQCLDFRETYQRAQITSSDTPGASAATHEGMGDHA